MNGRILGALFVAAVVCFPVLSCNTSQQPANGQPAAKALQWEYHFEKGDWEPDSLTAGFNKLGTDGWEYVGNINVPLARGAYCFKRPKR
jgi:hypothetical protein